MTRRLGGNGRSFSILATASLAAALACGSGAMVGCGSSSSGGGGPDSGPADTGGGDVVTTDAGGHDADASQAMETGPEASPESSTNDAAMEAALTQLAAPQCNPNSGMTFTSTGSVTLTATGLPTNGFIYYTTNGTNPNSGSTVYSSAITFGCQGNACPLTEDIRAIASAPGYLDSTVTNCSYTVNGAPPGTVSNPTFSPPAEKSDNDIPVSITSDPGATICYTTGGQTPACDNTTSPATCLPGSNTFLGTGAQILVTGGGTLPNYAITSPSGADQGQVTINAIACATGKTSSQQEAATYTLQAATPTMASPAGGSALKYDATGTGFDPTIVTDTVSSTTNVQLWYTVGAPPATPPTCITGAGPIPATGGGSSGLIGSAGGTGGIGSFNTNTTFQTIACKQGYLPSAVTPISYTVQLNPPTFSPTTAAAPTDNIFTASVVDGVNSGATAANYGASDWACVTVDGTTNPVCDNTNAGKCVAGAPYATAGGSKDILYSASTDTAAGAVNVNGAILQAVSCGGSTWQASSPASNSGAYTLQLDPIAFSWPSGTIIPAGTGSLTVTMSQSTPSGLPYDYICWSSDGTTVPSCASGCPASGVATGLQHTSASSGSYPPSLTLTTSTKLQAVGCLNAPAGNDTNNFLPSDTPPATASYQSGVTMAAPTILPLNNVVNDTPLTVQFTNNEPSGGATAYFCVAQQQGGTPAVPSCDYSTTPTTDANANGCGGGSLAYGVSGVAPKATSTAADSATVTVTDWVVSAVACDLATTKTTSLEATNGPITYTLQVGNPTITPASGSVVNLGQVIEFSTVTGNVGLSYFANMVYTTDGTTPDCAALGTSHSILADNPIGSPPTSYAAYYSITGQEKEIKVVGCETGFTSSATTASATYTYTVAPPTFLYGSAGSPYDDIGWDDTVTVQPAISNTWLCLGTTTGCGAAPNTCNGGTAQTVTSGTMVNTVSYVDPPGTPTNAASPAPAYAWQADLIGATGTTQAIYSCATPGFQGGVANTTTVQGGPTTASYTANVSALAFSPTPPNNPPGSDITTVTVSLVPSKQYPGDPDGTVAHEGTTADTYICASATNQAIPTQTNSCLTMVNTLPSGWTCNCGAVGSCTTATGAPQSVTYSDVGQNTTYSAFSCKDLMNYSSITTQAYTFQPYSHTIGMTGAVTDFNAGNEGIPGFTHAGLFTTTAFVSWDPTYLYVGQQGPADLSTCGGHCGVHFYIGGPTASTATNEGVSGGASGQSFDGTQTIPTGFNALYHVYWRIDGTLQGMDQFSAGAWGAGTAPTNIIYNQTSEFIEFQILRTAIGSPTDVHLLGAIYVVSPNADWYDWPGSVDTETTWAGWQTEYLNDAYLPNDTNFTGTVP